MMPRFTHLRPTTLAEATRALGSPGARVHAGGTDLLGCLRDGVFGVETVVSLTQVPGLAGIRATSDGGVTVGAMTRLTDVASSKLLRTRCRALADAAAAVASPQLRNQGTLGGNLCQKPRCWYYRGDFPCLRKGGELCSAFDGDNRYHCVLGGDRCFVVHPSDTAPALVALDAAVRLVGGASSRVLPVERLHMPPSEDPQRETRLEPGELITDVVVPPSAGVRSSYRKVRGRGAWDFALAGVALALTFDGETVTRARVVLSGAAPVPWRSLETEQALVGHPLDRETVARAAAAVMAAAEPLAHNGYKVPMFRGLLTEQLEAMGSSLG